MTETGRFGWQLAGCLDPLRAGHLADRRNPVRQLAGEPARHEGAIRDAGRVDPVRVDRRPSGDVVDDRGEECHVVDPGSDLGPAIVPLPVDAVRTRHEPAARVGLDLETGQALDVVGRASSTMELEHERPGPGRKVGRDMEDVVPRSTADVEHDPVVAWRRGSARGRTVVGHPPEPGAAGRDEAGRQADGDRAEGQDMRPAHGPSLESDGSAVNGGGRAVRKPRVRRGAEGDAGRATQAWTRKVRLLVFVTSV